ncbi:RNA polymerase sigma factor [Archangium sp. Cb G35]|uniref:RNA polymerase sigma factor n=1 Tax=Archangium sp. Cb G35 TaxID=1920190 RepID=UPI0009FB0DCB|nr:sigma-70 family RNA polymerase sigma factor [Archangium sp. Cb G35]
MPRLPWPIRDAWLSRLAVRSQRGDREAFRDLYRALYDPVSRYVHRRVPSKADAEDIVGQVFFRLLESLERIDTRRGSVLSYTLFMARNALVDHVRGRAGQVPEEAAAAVPDSAVGPLERLMGQEDVERVRRELARLPAETRELLMLRFGDGLRFAEVAQVMGLSEAAVRQRTSRAVRELRARWDAGPARGELANDG